MYRPKTVGSILHNHFAEQAVPVSIATDTFDPTDDSPYRVFFNLEPPEIVPLEQRLIDNCKFYNIVLAWNERILVECPNAVKFIFGSCSWAENPADDCDVSQKKFSVSYLTSAKRMCQGHNFRHEIFNKLPAQSGQLTITKHMSPPVLECKRPMLYPYRYSIVCENTRRNNWISEKLIDCLVSRTIPIYWGAPNVSEIFNVEGILSFETYDSLIHILDSLTPEDYNRRLKAIEDNLHRAMLLTNVHARIDSEIRSRLSNANYIGEPSNQPTRQGFRQRSPKRK